MKVERGIRGEMVKGKRKYLSIFLFFIVFVLILSGYPSFAGEKVFFYHTDAAGTPLAITDESGNVVWRADYKPFGEEQSVAGTVENNKQFVGKEKDEETGLYYFGARYMMSEVGRFISPDPVMPVDPRTSKTNESLLLNPQKINRYSYGLNNPYRYVDVEGRYERDVHFTLTKYLAIKAGFTPAQALQIATANQGTDENPNTSPYAGIQARKDYHFVTKERLSQMYEAAYASGNLELFGQFLHALQDSYSHAGYGPGLGHFWKGHAPDKTYNDPEKANTMAEDTYKHMLLFLNSLGKNVPDRWDKFKTRVDQFNRAKTIREKERILAE